MSRKTKSRKNRQQAAEKEALKQAVQAAVAPPADLAKVGTFLDDLRKEKAAQLLAEKELTATSVAAAVGVSREAIRLWGQEPAFQARVEEISQHLSDLSMRFVIARRVYRVASLNERHQRMQRVIDARAAEPEMQQAPGGDTGLLVRQRKMLGSGVNAHEIVEFVFDAALPKEMRETEDQAAQEVGQKITKVAPTTPDGKDEYSGIPALTLEEFRRLPIGERIRLLRTPLLAPPEHREQPPPSV